MMLLCQEQNRLGLTMWIFLHLVRLIRKDERKYYEELIVYSRKSLMLFPYHLADVVVRILNVTPFQYYVGMLEYLMDQEKSYDSLPNFTAADCE